MEEASALCDRVAVLVGGRLRCVGPPGELSLRFGDFWVAQLSLRRRPGPAAAASAAVAAAGAAADEAAAVALLSALCPGARLIYGLNGSLKFELPRAGVTLRRLYAGVAAAARCGSLPLQDFAVAGASLEQAFLAVAGGSAKR
jgi:ABC-type multidrug transport system ATPase subunit